MTYNISEGRPLTVLVQLFRAELGLDASQVKILSNEKIIPNDGRLYLGLSDLFGEVRGRGTDSSFNEATQEMEYYTYINFFNRIQVDAYSETEEVIDRKEEIPLALLGYTAQELQHTYAMSFQLTPNASANFIKESTDVKILNRYVFEIDVWWMKQRVTNVPYYDTFKIGSLYIDQ